MIRFLNETAEVNVLGETLAFLLKHLMRIARRNGIGGFTAEVLVENKPMQAVFNKAECKIGSKLVGNVYHYDLEFE